eukprot:SAG11_NODE_3062_length_2717_cov_3.550420_4_plen_157_part_00
MGSSICSTYRAIFCLLGRRIRTVNLALYEKFKALALQQRPSCGSTSYGSPASPNGGGYLRYGAVPESRIALEQQLTAVEALLIGASAQGIAGFCTNPIDVLKTRVQADSASTSASRAASGGSFAGAAAVQKVGAALLAQHGMQGLLRVSLCQAVLP